MKFAAAMIALSLLAVPALAQTPPPTEPKTLSMEELAGDMNKVSSCAVAFLNLARIYSATATLLDMNIDDNQKPLADHYRKRGEQDLQRLRDVSDIANKMIDANAAALGLEANKLIQDEVEMVAKGDAEVTDLLAHGWTMRQAPQVMKLLVDTETECTAWIGAH